MAPGAVHTGTYVVGYRRGHPRLKQRMSLKQYLAENHIAALPWNDADRGAYRIWIKSYATKNRTP